MEGGHNPKGRCSVPRWNAGLRTLPMHTGQVGRTLPNWSLTRTASGTSTRSIRLYPDASKNRVAVVVRR